MFGRVKNIIGGGPRKVAVFEMFRGRRCQFKRNGLGRDEQKVGITTS